MQHGDATGRVVGEEDLGEMLGMSSAMLDLWSES
jgi:hypothetical protein